MSNINIEEEKYLCGWESEYGYNLSDFNVDGFEGYKIIQIYHYQVN